MVRAAASPTLHATPGPFNGPVAAGVTAACAPHLFHTPVTTTRAHLAGPFPLAVVLLTDGLLPRAAASADSRAMATPDADPPRVCQVCLRDAPHRCARCGHVRYCSPGCQREHWPAHKPHCPELPSAGAALARDAGRSAESKLARLCALGSVPLLRGFLEGLGQPAATEAVRAVALQLPEALCPRPPSRAGGPGSKAARSPREAFSAVHVALAHGHVGLARVLVEDFSGDVDARSSPHGLTPLLLLLHRGWVGLAAAAVEALRPDGGAAAGWGLAPLHTACRLDASGALTAALLRAGASPAALDADGLSPLHHAAAGGHVAALRALLAAGGAFPDPTDEGARAMAAAAAEARRRQLEAAGVGGGEGGEDEPPTDSDEDDDVSPSGGPRPIPRDAAAAGFVDGHGDGGGGDRPPPEWLHPIHCAMTAGRAAAVEALLDAPISVPLGLVQPTSGDTLLHAAAKCGHGGVLAAVLARLPAGPSDARRALLEAVNDAGCTPLVDAIAARRFDAAAALLGAGAWAGARAPALLAADFPDALAMAVSAGQEGLVEALLAAGGADPNAVNGQGETTFHLACSMGLPRVAGALLRAGADPTATVPGTGETALHLLAQRSEDGASQDAACGGAEHDAPARRQVAELLLAAGVGVNARTAMGGHTPVWLAAFHASPELAVWLVRHGGDPTLPDDGKNPALRPADALQAPALNEARRAYAPSPRAFAEGCAALAARLRGAWEEARQRAK